MFCDGPFLGVQHESPMHWEAGATPVCSSVYGVWLWGELSDVHRGNPRAEMNTSLQEKGPWGSEVGLTLVPHQLGAS